MSETRTEGLQDPGELDEGLLKAISHPLRHRLLSMLDGRTASPNELARELGMPLGRVSYHIRLLADLGAIELVDTQPRRGALEHFYRAVTSAWFGEGDWARLPRSARRGILGHNLQQIFDWVTVAAENGGFEQPGSEVLRTTLTLDAQGREEVSRIAREALERARAVNAQVADRRAEGDEPPATTELTILHFERRA
jgi:DNA-binding transcriptional ArsR family regulator